MLFVPGRTWTRLAPGGACVAFLALVVILAAERNDSTGPRTADTTAAVTRTPSASVAPNAPLPAPAATAAPTRVPAIVATRTLEAIAATATSAATMGAISTTFSIGTSVEGRPIEVTTLGSGPVAVAFVGNIHGGWEPMAREIVVSALEYFTRNTQTVSPQVTLYFVPTVNPDGFERGKPLWATADGSGGPADALLARTAFNANGVDLNRNFPIRWSPNPCGGEKYLLQFGEICKNGAAGSHPFSEPETLAYQRFIIQHNVRVALTYHEDNTPSVSVREGGGGPSEPLALKLSHVLDYPYIPVWAKYPVTGQAQDWLDSAGVLGVEVELKYRTVDLNHNIAAMQAAIDGALAG